ncbi:hypothetical protein TNCV_2442981 [Trichonephila clavipes]|nr:hypothetical protein TNCV_2442981 [Trichonephila clavipes]
MNAFGDGPCNFEPWSSEVDNMLNTRPLLIPPQLKDFKLQLTEPASVPCKQCCQILYLTIFSPPHGYSYPVIGILPSEFGLINPGNLFLHV